MERDGRFEATISLTLGPHGGGFFLSFFLYVYGVPVVQIWIHGICTSG